MILRGTLKYESQQKFCKTVVENNGRVKMFLQKKREKAKQPKDFKANQTWHKARNLASDLKLVWYTCSDWRTSGSTFRVLPISQLHNLSRSFTTWTLCKIPSLPLALGLYSFSRFPRFITTGEDRNKNWYQNWQLCGVWKLPFCDHRAIKLTQNCVCFTNPLSTSMFSHSWVQLQGTWTSYQWNRFRIKIVCWAIMSIPNPLCVDIMGSNLE